jgi:hypothetical protein
VHSAGQTGPVLHLDFAVTLRRVYVFFVLEIGTRHVHILGATTNPDRPWTVQQARNLLADLSERVHDVRFLIRDRAGQFTNSFDTVLADMGSTVVKIPPRCPQANCYAERFVRTVRAELTGRMLIFGQRYLRLLLGEYVRHYNTRRPHRGQHLRPPRPDQPIVPKHTRILRRPIPAASSMNTNALPESVVHCRADYWNPTRRRRWAGEMVEDRVGGDAVGVGVHAAVRGERAPESSPERIVAVHSRGGSPIAWPARLSASSASWRASSPPATSWPRANAAVSRV